MKTLDLYSFYIISIKAGRVLKPWLSDIVRNDNYAIFLIQDELKSWIGVLRGKKFHPCSKTTLYAIHEYEYICNYIIYGVKWNGFY